MRPGAQIQAAIEIIDHYNPSLGPLDGYVSKYLKQHRYIGAKDRRRLTALVFGIYRHYHALEWILKQYDVLSLSGRLLTLIYLKEVENSSTPEIIGLFSGEVYHPSALTKEEIHLLTTPLQSSQPEWAQLSIPQWLYDRLRHNFDTEIRQHLEALNQQATVDLRVNLLLVQRDEAFKALQDQGLSPQYIPYSPLGIRLPIRVNLKALKIYQEGLVDIQDAGAQLLCILCDVSAGMTVCDYCAGAGGKALTLAVLMQNQGTLIATDISFERMKEIKARMNRSRIQIINQYPSNKVHEQFNHSFDRVLVDVPCSGTGTLRRHPELKLALSSQKIEELIHLQREILSKAQELVKPGGRLIYGTCSLLKEENEDQVTWFLQKYSDFRLIPVQAILNDINPCREFLQVSPYTHQMDGFFGAVLERIIIY